MIIVTDWSLLAIGLFFIWAAFAAGWRQFRTGVARDGEQLGANRFARRTHPVAYWSLMVVNGLGIALGGWCVALGLGATS